MNTFWKITASKFQKLLERKDNFYSSAHVHLYIHMDNKLSKDWNAESTIERVILKHIYQFRFVARISSSDQ